MPRCRQLGDCSESVGRGREATEVVQNPGLPNSRTDRAGEGAFTGPDRCGELESPPGEGHPFLSTALGSGRGRDESGEADGRQGPVSPASSPGPTRALSVSSSEATNCIVIGQRY